MENPLFEQTCRRAVSLEVGGVEHQGAIKRRLICQFIENFVENSEFTPPKKMVVQGWAVLIRSILPLKSVLDDVDNTADDASVIHTGSTVRTGKERFDTFQLAFGKIKQGTHGNLRAPCNTLFSFLGK